MVLNKALLIKGLVGTTSALGISAGAYFGRDKISEWLETSKDTNNQANNGTQVDQQQESIVKKAGLTCGDENSTTGSDCTIDTTKLKVDQDGTKTEGFSSQTGSGKIKLQKLTGENTDGYNQGFKLSIEDGDISLTSTTSSSTTIKLEQFETYEIKAGENGDSDKYYLTRKDKSIRELLGLPSDCNLPDSNTSTCTIESTAINNIKFDGKSEITNSSSSSLSLTITKVSNTDSDFSPYNYKFSFKTTNSGDITISKSAGSSINIKSDKGTEFKIKKNSTDNSLSLEEVWTLNKLLEKVGLTTCTTNSTDCSIGNSGLNVKQGESNKKENNKKTDSSGTSGGKIKLYTGTNATGYEYGFKFAIEDGDIALNEGTGSGTISKLEQFETYEIKKDETDSKYYLSRKKKASESIKAALGLPSDCNLPEGESTSELCCNITVDKLKTINFEGKNSSGTPTIDNSGTAKLKISKTNDTTTYPNGGYKFVFETDKNISIPGTSTNPIHIKRGTNTEFKIKKEGNTLTLEKAWTLDSLAEKINLKTCTTTNDQKQCTFGSTINVFNSSTDYITDATVETGKTIIYVEDSEGHNQGFKFYVNEDTNLNPGSKTGSIEKIEKKEENNGPTYEIKQQTVNSETKWYLSKVASSSND